MHKAWEESFKWHYLDISMVGLICKLATHGLRVCLKYTDAQIGSHLVIKFREKAILTEEIWIW